VGDGVGRDGEGLGVTGTDVIGLGVPGLGVIGLGSTGSEGAASTWKDTGDAINSGGAAHLTCTE
jgi:hypothetical protein